MNSSFRSVLLAALVGGVLCACAKSTATRAVSEPSEKPLASTPSADVAAPPSEPSISPSASPPEPEPPSDREKSCGRFFRALDAEELAEGIFRMKRADLLRSVDRALARIEETTFFAPPPTKTERGEVAYVLLAVGKKATCGFQSLDFVVRVNGVLLSDVDRRAEAYAQLRSASRLEVEIERRATPDGAHVPMTLVYLLED